MSTSIERSPMENSTILREIAEFDINAPISVSISFEDDLNETPIKTEIETNDYQENQKPANSAFVPILEPKTEINADTVTPCELAEEITNEVTVHETVRDTSAFQPDNLQNQLSPNDNARKRKTVDIYISKSKKNKSTSDTGDKNNRDEEISSDMFSHTKENYNLTGLAASENEINITSFNHNVPHVVSTVNKQSDQNLDGKGPQRTDRNKINEYGVNCMTSLSDVMRRVMQSYGAYKRKQISKEEYIKIKLLLFKSAYKTVVTMLVPKETNNEFISTFLKDTVQRARINSGTYFMHTYEDYANLVLEMINWTKKQQQHSQKVFRNSEQPIPVRNSVISEPQTNPAQGNIQVGLSNTEKDKVCIFSSGPPEREIRINIDPTLNKHLPVNYQNNNAETNQLSRGAINNNGDMLQDKTAIECLTRLVGNNSKPMHQSVIQTTTPQTPNLLTNPQQHHILASNSLYYSMKNMASDSVPSQHMRDPTPVLRMQLGMNPLQSNLIQPVESQRPPPSYEHSRHYALQAQAREPMPPQPTGQSRYLQAQAYAQQQVPPTYNQVPVVQTRSTPTQFQQEQYVQGQFGPQYVQQQQMQPQFGQSHLPVPEYNLTRQPQMGISQQAPQQNIQPSHPQTTEHWPSLVELLSTETRPPLPASNERIQSGLSGQWQSQNQQSQVPPSPSYRTEWQQGLNATLQATQVPQNAQKGAPRSASTDSGFISPLNFNIPTDQTMPAMPQEPEPTMPMIVHVTSLSDKASYLETGICVVCKKSTKQMCMGCMKVYYCNFECQAIDWAAHVPNCMQPSTN